jgi:hypothetical protein
MQQYLATRPAPGNPPSKPLHLLHSTTLAAYHTSPELQQQQQRTCSTSLPPRHRHALSPQLQPAAHRQLLCTTPHDTIHARHAISDNLRSAIEDMASYTPDQLQQLRGGLLPTGKLHSPTPCSQHTGTKRTCPCGVHHDSQQHHSCGDGLLAHHPKPLVHTTAALNFFQRYVSCNRQPHHTVSKYSTLCNLLLHTAGSHANHTLSTAGQPNIFRTAAVPCPHTGFAAFPVACGLHWSMQPTHRLRPVRTTGEHHHRRPPIIHYSAHHVADTHCNQAPQGRWRHLAHQGRCFTPAQNPPRWHGC